MKVVWSFWTKPFRRSQKLRWNAERYHLLSWILSVETARHHFDCTELFTDDLGASLLVDCLGLHFDRVSTDLNKLAHHDSDWWTLGKLYTYRAQTEPFVHVDNDVYLWKALPDRLTAAPVIAQNPERFRYGGGLYEPEIWEVAVMKTGGWLPPEWLWYTSIRGNEAICCGIFGGSLLPFIQHYAETAILMIEHPGSQKACALIKQKSWHNILFEQFFLSACLHFHSTEPAGRFRDAHVECVFRSERDGLERHNRVETGYTHLIGTAKQNVELLARLEARVERDYPEHYMRALSACDEKLVRTVI